MAQQGPARDAGAQHAFQVAALGRVLDITLRGPMSRTTLFFPPLFREFEEVADPSWPRVQCAWTCLGDGPMDNGVEGWADVRWERKGLEQWRYDTFQLSLELGVSQSIGRFTDTDGALENLLRATLTFPFQPDRGLVFHAATPVFRNASGERCTVLLAGFSGAGKSTISREGGWEELLTNEMSFVEQRQDGWWAHPSPFWGKGDVARRASGPARLVGVAILEQAVEANVWTPLRPAETMLELAGRAGTMSDQQPSERGYLARLGALCTAMPCFRFAWHRGSPPLQGSPWMVG